ncbi:hypothetical protein BD770DRAFT_394276 [Pilaira anomala]|nr:hypothetical protein BD770DRAFT_394276 [Pilaira anomala]
MFNGRHKKPVRDNAGEVDLSDVESMSIVESSRSVTPNVNPDRETPNEATPAAGPPKDTSRRRPSSRPDAEQTFDHTEEERFPNSQYKRANYPLPEEQRFIKKMKWERMPEVTCKQLRKIMMDEYTKTLLAVAGSTPDNLSKDLEDCLKRVAREVNQNVKRLLVPGHVDINLLNPSIAKLNEELDVEIEVAKRQLAHRSLVKEKQDQIQLSNMEEIKSLQQKCFDTSQKLVSHPIKKKPKSQDYVQSLMVNPSQVAFDYLPQN